jgi:hypothetical protein
MTLRACSAAPRKLFAGPMDITPRIICGPRWPRSLDGNETAMKLVNKRGQTWPNVTLNH